MMGYVFFFVCFLLGFFFFAKIDFVKIKIKNTLLFPKDVLKKDNSKNF